MSLARTEYYRTGLLSVRHVACRSAEKGAGDVETQAADTLVLPLRGLFMEHFSRSAQVLAEPNVALVFPAGLSYRVSHPVSTEDDCLAIEFSEGCFGDVLESMALPGAPLASCSLLSPSAMAARNLLWRRLAQRHAGPLEVEETALSLLSYAMRRAREDRARLLLSTRMIRQIETARVVLLLHPERKWSLSALAHAVGCSPFHLARMFRERVGVTLHRYHLQTRLARALDLLLETDRDLAAVALELGFSSHSHFTASFRQAVGISPSRLREVASSRIAAEIRKILIAHLS